MKKKITVMCAIWLLMLALAPAALAADPSGMGGMGNQGSDANLNEMFARLQMDLAQSSKDSALGYMDEIEKLQSEQKELAGYLEQARTLQAQAKSSGSYTRMPDAMKHYMDQNHLAYDRTGGDALQDKDEWNVAIQSLQARQERLGTDIQQQMVHVQDFMGQYNSYIQGSNSANNNSSLGTLSSIARGQSLFSAEGAAALSLPPIATSLLIGVLVGMAVMWGVQRKRLREAER